MMQRKNTLYIGGIPYTVVEVDAISKVSKDGDRVLCAIVDMVGRTIRTWKDPVNESYWHSMFHEILHALTDSFKIGCLDDQDEKKHDDLDRLAALFCDFIFRNNILQKTHQQIARDGLNIVGKPYIVNLYDTTEEISNDPGRDEFFSVDYYKRIIKLYKDPTAEGFLQNLLFVALTCIIADINIESFTAEDKEKRTEDIQRLASGLMDVFFRNGFMGGDKKKCKKK